MASSSSPNGNGIGFFGLLTIVFITLKLTDHIDWSWWWVLAPMWMPFVLVIIILLLILSAGGHVKRTK